VPCPQEREIRQVKPDIETLLSAEARRVEPYSWPRPPVPVSFNFDQGIPSPEAFPIDDLSRLAQEVLRRDHGRALEYISFDGTTDEGHISYSDTYPEMAYGYRGLREQLATWLAVRNRRADIGHDDIMLTLGSVQGLALMIEAFVGESEGVLMEAPTFPYAVRFATLRGADLRGIPMDRDGADVDVLEANLRSLVAAGRRAKLFYTIPTFQTPTGTCMSLERRHRVLELADEYDFLVLEDVMYADFRFEGDPLPSLFELDTSERVIQSNSFSKLVAPALRLGWMAGAPHLIESLTRVRQDLGVSQWTARMMEAYLAENLLDPQIMRSTEIYHRKRDVAAGQFHETCAPWVDFDLPAGGFYLWLRISDGVDWDKARIDAALRGVACRPGEVFGGGADARRFMRVAFSHASDDELRRGIRILGEAISGAVHD
jgi:2-aminoadipate transaminase